MLPGVVDERRFCETMPARYRQLYHGPTVLEHAAIVARRGSSPAHGEVWRRIQDGGAIACVVTEERPGAAHYLGTAFATRSIDILSAQVYFRRGAKGSEVVELFWVGRGTDRGAPVEDADLAHIADLIGGLMTGELRINGRPLSTPLGASPRIATLVRCDAPSGPGGAPVTLTVETIERPGLFATITGALVQANVRILKSIRTGGPRGQVTHQFAIADHDGRRPDQYRRGILQAEILRVLEPGHGSARR